GVDRGVEGRRDAEDADEGRGVLLTVGQIARRDAGLGDGVPVGLAEGALGTTAAAVALPACLARLRRRRALAVRVRGARDRVAARAARPRRAVLADLARVGAAGTLTVAARALRAAQVGVVAEAAEHTTLRAGVPGGGRLRRGGQVERDRQAADRVRR